MDIGKNIGIFTDYRPNIGKAKISVSVADMSIQIYQYRQKYMPGTYIGIGIDWTHIGLSLKDRLICNKQKFAVFCEGLSFFLPCRDMLDVVFHGAELFCK